MRKFEMGWRRIKRENKGVEGFLGVLQASKDPG
jgi:hypothetical protein